jgi:Na+/H+ antiporter NhaD/arsenite permease-like protein
MNWLTTQTLAALIFGVTYLGIIFTRFPKVNMDRTSAAFTGAIAMVLFSVISFEEAIAAVDFNTILLLMGMMMMVAMLQLDGFFDVIAYYTSRWAKTRTQLLALSILVTGLSSAFLVNDAAVLIFTPLLILLCSSAKLNPMPYLIGEIVSSNIGSCLTITGNPQNMLIGIHSDVAFGRFLLFMLPVVIGTGIFAFWLIKHYYRTDFADNSPLDFGTKFSFNLKKMRYSLFVFGAVIIGFFFGKLLQISIPMIAISGAALMILFGKTRPSKVMKEVDWVLLLFFASLFIVVHAAEQAGVFDQILEQTRLTPNAKGVGVLLGINLVMSQVVSNVPFTVLMLPLMKSVNSEMMWVALAGASTLAGNATLIGAVANLIVAESARKQGIRIKFLPFLKIS